ncbi:MAG: TonB-dependent receptor [Sulfurimonas sp.]|nr:TonB-dependent receptor [Sulfurimonas sp.]
MKKTIKLSLISVALLSSLHAENQYTLDTISVTASQGTTLNKKDVTDSVTIITKEAIEESRVTTLDEALNKLGGISMTQNGGPGKSTSMFVRGMDTKRLLVLIDGVRYNNPTAIGAAAEFSQIMLYNVEQIEIIKGAQSGVWGSDATGGVINIITSKAKSGLHGIANLEYGSYNTTKTSLTASYGADKYDILIGGSIFNNDGFSAVEPYKASPNYGKRFDELGYEKDSYKNKSLNVKLGYNITKDDRLEATIQAINSFAKFDGTSGWPDYLPADSAIEEQDLKNRFYNLAFTHKDSMNDIKVNYSLSTFKREYTDGSGDTTYEGSVNEIKVDDKISYMKNSFIRVGASYQKFEQKEITANTDKDYSATSVFATNYNKLELFSNLNTIVTESVRYDNYDNFDDSLTGKLGLKQFIYKDFYLSSNIGTGFNAPTLGQLYGQWGANPNLKPEKSLTSDITLGNDTVWVTGFYNEITDMIEYIGAGYVQIDGKSKFEGIELGYEDYFLNSLGINAMYTYVKTENADGEALARRPKTQLDASLTYYISDDFDLGLNTQYIGTRYNSVDNQGAQTGEYTLYNFVTNIKANDYITFYGKIDNLSDVYYQTVDGYATAGRSLYFGLNAKY